MYVPNNQNVPMFQEKGEVRATVGTRNFQGAYAVTDNLGVMANAQIGKSEWSVDLSGENVSNVTRRNLFEAGAGMFKATNNTSLECYGGAGFGQVRFDRESDIVGNLATYKANMMKFFIQPSVGSSTENFDAGFSTRFSGIKFNNIDSTGYTYQDLVNEEINDLEQPFHLFMEPAVTLRAGYRWFKVHSQVGYSIKLTDAQLNYNPFIFTLGFHFTLANRYNE